MEAVIKRKILGSVEESFHNSYTYFVSLAEAEKIGSAAGLIAKGVKKVSSGFELFLTCEEEEAIKKVLLHNGVTLKFESK